MKVNMTGWIYDHSTDDWSVFSAGRLVASGSGMDSLNAAMRLLGDL